MECWDLIIFFFCFRFNRVFFLNVGFLEVRDNNCDYIVMYDVDFFLFNKDLYYGFFEKGFFYVFVFFLYLKYYYFIFVGGIFIMFVV